MQVWDLPGEELERCSWVEISKSGQNAEQKAWSPYDFLTFSTTLTKNIFSYLCDKNPLKNVTTYILSIMYIACNDETREDFPKSSKQSRE